MNAYNQITPETIQEDMRYLQLLSHSFPTIADASTEIINLEASLTFPREQNIFWRTYMENMKLFSMCYVMLREPSNEK